MSDVASRTVRIHMNGWARLSPDLVPDGAEWLFINVGKDRQHVSVRTTCNYKAGAVKLDFHHGRRKSPVFWFRPWLFKLGIAAHRAVGTYSAVRSASDTVVINLKKPLRLRAGGLKPARTQVVKNLYRRRSARFRAIELCWRPQGATVTEIAKIADELNVQLQPILRSVRNKSIHGYKVTLGPRNSIKLTPP